MKTLRNSDYLEITLDETNNFFEVRWKDTTEKMTNQEFKDEMLAYASFFNLGAKSVIHNMIDMRYTVVPEIQVWVDTTINTRGLAAGMERAAFVLSSDIFASVSVEQTNEEENAKNINMRYFDSVEEARKWLTL